MRHQHIPSILIINLFPSKYTCHRIGISLRCFIPEHISHMGRLQERHKIEVHFSVFILQGNLLKIFCLVSRRRSRQIDLMSLKNRRRILQPLSRIMIPADDQNRNCWCDHRKTCQELIKHRDCLCRRNRTVIDVPRDHNCIRTDRTGILRHLHKDCLLIFS